MDQLERAVLSDRQRILSGAATAFPFSEVIGKLPVDRHNFSDSVPVRAAPSTCDPLHPFLPKQERSDLRMRIVENSSLIDGGEKRGWGPGQPKPKKDDDDDIKGD